MTVGRSASLSRMNKVDRELAQIEARKAEAEGGARAPKTGIGARVKRAIKDMLVRSSSTKQ
jgi:hypothetical protein